MSRLALIILLSWVLTLMLFKPVMAEEDTRETSPVEKPSGRAARLREVVVTGTRTTSKLDSKRYYRHSGYPGGLKVQTLRQLLAKHPDRVIQKAVWGMLPHNRLGRKLLKRLKVYAGPEHPHAAQKPQPIE